MIPFPDKKYKILYSDPGWSYNDKCHAGQRGAEYKYRCSSVKEICSLPVQDICDDDCALFLWVTMPQLPNAFKVMESWGFIYKTCAFTWIKKNKKSDSLFWGMGHSTRSNAELCLLGIKGKMKRISASVHSVIMSPVRRHSEKPDEVRDRIVQLYGDLPRIELFGRKQVPGWSVWGDEV